MCRPAARAARPALSLLAAGALAASLLALAAAPRPAHAAEPVDAVLADFQAHGHASPPLALERLQAAAPSPAAPLDQRWRHQATLADLALRSGDRLLAQAATARLQAMAVQERCAPCATALAIRQAQQAEAGDAATLRRQLGVLSALPLPADPGQQFEWHLAQATARTTLGEHDQAIADALRASEAATVHDRPADLVQALSVLSSINATRRDLDRSIAYARQGVALAREIGFRHGLVRLLVTHSYALATLKENTERKAVLEELLPLVESTPGLETDRQNTLINLAALSNDLRDHRKAVDYALRAERVTNRDGDPNGHAFALVNRGVAWVHLGRSEEGLALVKTAIDIAEKTGDQRELADLVEQQVDALEAAGRPHAALQSLRRWVSLNNALTTSQREQAVAQLQEGFAAQQRQRQIDNLRLDNEVRAWRERAWAVAAVLVALAAFITWKRLARSRHINRGLRQDVARLADESQHDALTGAFNRRQGEALLQQLQVQGPRRPVSLLLLDVDHFKRVNDNHGHAAGDAVLVEMTRRLHAMLRDGDAVVRWGGEEFLLVLPGTDEAALPAIARRVLGAIGAQPVALPQGPALPVRASAGGVVWAAGSASAWAGQLALADAALYRAKAEGRNRVVCAFATGPVPDDDSAPLDTLAAQGRLQLATVEGFALPAAAPAPAPVALAAA